MNKHLRKDLLLKEVRDEQNQIAFLMLDEERREVYKIVWKKQAYDATTKKYVDSEEKMKQLEDWAQRYLGTTLDNLESVVGQRFDVYNYKTYDSFWECDAKVTKDMVGTIESSTIKDIQMNDEGIIIRFDIDEETYSSRMRFTEKVGEDYFISPKKKESQLERFENKFGVPIAEKDKLIGEKIMVEFKEAFNNPFAEIKNLPKKKKK